MLTDTVAEIFAPMQIIIVLGIALLVLGPGRMPEFARQIGGALRQFRKLTGDLLHGVNDDSEGAGSEQAPWADAAGNGRRNGRGDADLTDYTLAGQPVSDGSERSGPTSQAALSSDYVIVSPGPTVAPAQKTETH